MASSSPPDPRVKPDLILIEVAHHTAVDNGTIAAAVEHIISSNCLRQSKTRSSKPSLAILAIDSLPTTYRPLCTRASHSPHVILDAYTHWLPPPPSTKPLPVSGDKRTPFVHIADTTANNDKVLASIARAVVKRLDAAHHETDTERIVVIDSLSTLLRYHNGLQSVLQLLHHLCAIPSPHIHNPFTVIATMHSEHMPPPLSASLRTLADTHVRLHQPPPTAPTPSAPKFPTNNMELSRDNVHLHIRRRKPSGRVVTYRIDARFHFDTAQLVDAVTVSEDTANANTRKSGGDTRDETNEKSEMELAQRGLTFRLSLSSKEREMRAAAGLPYLHQDEALADSALELHPKDLQIGDRAQRMASDEEGSFSDDEDDDDDEELFSEDV